MRISTFDFKSEYFRVFLMSEGRAEKEIDRHTLATSAAMQMLYWYVVVKREQNGKAKLLIYWSTYAHLWPQAVGSERNNEIVDISDRNDFPLNAWMCGLSLRDRIRCSAYLSLGRGSECVLLHILGISA